MFSLGWKWYQDLLRLRPLHEQPGKRTKDPTTPSHHPRQPILVDLPMVGEVPLILKTLLNLYAWTATDAHGKDDWMNTRCIVPSF